MKTNLFATRALLAAALITPMISTSALAASDTFSANATVLVPIAITNTADLEFGNIAPTGVASTTVHIDAAGARTGTAALLSGSPTPAAAAFTVTGVANEPYHVTRPTDGNLVSSSDTLPIAFLDVDISGTAATETLDADGSVTLTTGGTVTLDAAQAAGSYTGTFTMTVDYE